MYPPPSTQTAQYATLPALLVPFVFSRTHIEAVLGRGRVVPAVGAFSPIDPAAVLKGRESLTRKRTKHLTSRSPSPRGPAQSSYLGGPGSRGGRNCNARCKREVQVGVQSAGQKCTMLVCWAGAQQHRSTPTWSGSAVSAVYGAVFSTSPSPFCVNQNLVELPGKGEVGRG